MILKYYIKNMRIIDTKPYHKIAYDEKTGVLLIDSESIKIQYSINPKDGKVKLGDVIDVYEQFLEGGASCFVFPDPEISSTGWEAIYTEEYEKLRRERSHKNAK